MSPLLISLALLLTGGVGALVLSKRPAAALGFSMGAIGLASAVAIATALMTLIQSAASVAQLRWPLPIGAVALRMDGLSAWFVLTSGILGIAVCIYAFDYYRRDINRLPVPAHA